MMEAVHSRTLSPSVAVDGVVLCSHPANRWRSHWHVLLVRRANDPFRGYWAFPGGFVDLGENLGSAVQREISEETGLSGLPFKQFAAYGDPKRDPRGHTVTVVYVAELETCMPEVEGGNDASDARWFSLDALPEMAFDHGRILDDIMVIRRRSI